MTTVFRSDAWGWCVHAIRYSLVLIMSISSFSLMAQTTIWSVDFETSYSDNDESAQDNNLPAGADWTKSGSSNNWWRVESDQVLNGTLSMSGRNTDATMTWTSETIDISGYSNVSISIEIKEHNADNGQSDIIETFYNLDGGGNVEFGDGNGDGDFNTATNTVTGLSGNNLVIVVTLFNNGSGERHIFDDITVTGTASENGGLGGVRNTAGSGSLSLWLDANQGVSTSGTAVTQWSDQSGNGNHATPPAASNQPTYVSSGTNSHPVITFDGGSDYLTASDATSLDLTTWTIIVVGIVNTHKNYNAFVVKGTDANENYEFLTNFPSTGNFHYPVKFTDASRSTDSESGETMSNSVYGVYQLDYDQSNFEFFINGNQTETDAETRTPQTNSNSLYICNEEGTSGRFANASVAEIAIFSSPINTAQRLIIHNAMSAKYGFSLDANDLYDEDNAGFDFDVAGIGQASDGTSHQDAQGTGVVRIYNPSGLANGEYLFWGHDNAEFDSDFDSDFPAELEARIERVWRASETGEVGTVSISFDLSDVPGSVTTSDLRLLIDTDNDGTFSDESTGGGGVISGASNTSGNIYEWTGIDIDNNERFTLGTINFSQTPLPVELVRFEATAYSDKDEVLLEWSTSSEINNAYFEIEKADESGDFYPLAVIDGQGTSNEVHHYELIDTEPYPGTNYYRLTQYDENGEAHVYPIQAVEFNALQNKTLVAFPNPIEAGNAIHLPIPQDLFGMEVHLQLFDQSGKSWELVTEVFAQGEGSELTATIPADIAQGIYVIALHLPGETPQYVPLVVR